MDSPLLQECHAKANRFSSEKRPVSQKWQHLIFSKKDNKSKNNKVRLYALVNISSWSLRFLPLLAAAHPSTPAPAPAGRVFSHPFHLSLPAGPRSSKKSGHAGLLHGDIYGCRRSHENVYILRAYSHLHLGRSLSSRWH
jgi:hypothetical protein